MFLTSSPSPALKGKCVAPGDKSISHRALILGALANGKTKISALLPSADIMSTANAMRAFGATVTNIGGNDWEVIGLGANGFNEPDNFIDFGNAGTGVRLTMGVAGSFPIKSFYTGDNSLRSRPMKRILDPLAQMGINYELRSGGKLPCVVIGTQNVKPITYVSPNGSAQVKSAILLCGLRANGTTKVIEPKPSRDHTENMLRAFGADVIVEDHEDGRHAAINGPVTLNATDVIVPGDPSSAAFPIVAALIIKGSDIIVENVMLNPLRAGVFQTLIEMGANIEYLNEREIAGEKIADIRAQYSQLNGIVVPPSRAPSMIDEYPILAVAAAFANGETIMDGIGELRIKESDRIKMMFDGLTSCGVNAIEGEESLTIKGGDVLGGGEIKTHGDHRIAMSFLILGMAAKNGVTVDEAQMIATSFPNFVELITNLGAKIK